MEWSRRELCLMLPALVVGLGLEADAEDVALPSKAYPFENLPVRVNGENKSRHVFGGKTHTGFLVELHETDLAPGSAPHPPHHHDHEEIFMMREGTLEVTIEGKTSRIGPGSAAYVASNEVHGIHNPGPGHAQYFVFALGTDKG